jgi:hypothetical protein
VLKALYRLGISLEGTRCLTPGWRSGFYWIAGGVNVPLPMSMFDHARKEAGIIACLDLSGDPERDLMRIAESCAGRCGRHPDLASPIRWPPESRINDKKPTPC